MWQGRIRAGRSREVSDDAVSTGAPDPRTGTTRLPGESPLGGGGPGVCEMTSRAESAAAEAAVEVLGVRKTFRSPRGAIQALRATSLRVRTGDFVCIVGPSGCGKSTLLSLIAGLDRPTAGSVRIKGREVKGPHEDLGIVFQRDLLLDWRNVLQNVLLQIEMRGLDKKRYVPEAERLLDMVGLDGFHTRHPRELSGGMRQRVSICRALVHDPAILLMDEPFGALDAMTRDQLNVDLERICGETRKTVVFVTHSIVEAVFLGDRVIVMSARPGRVVADIAVERPHPRSFSFQETPEFAGYVHQVRQVLEHEGVLRE
jgi:NitT/TauT family transport system ATP-binding protein